MKFLTMKRNKTIKPKPQENNFYLFYLICVYLFKNLYVRLTDKIKLDSWIETLFQMNCYFNKWAVPQQTTFVGNWKHVSQLEFLFNIFQKFLINHFSFAWKKTYVENFKISVKIIVTFIS